MRSAANKSLHRGRGAVALLFLIVVVAPALGRDLALPQTEESTLDRHGYYTNVDGDQVHQPAKSLNGTIPTGASAQCRDGDFSFSEHHSGTCSSHGGVAKWLR
jgi:hypothetical protein